MTENAAGKAVHEQPKVLLSGFSRSWERYPSGKLDCSMGFGFLGLLAMAPGLMIMIPAKRGTEQ